MTWLAAQLARVRLFMLVGSLVIPTASAAQGRFFADLGGGGQQPVVSGFSQSASFPLRGQTGTAKDDYPLKTGPAVDIGVGVRLTQRFSIVVAGTRYSSIQPANVTLTLPHPLVSNQSVTHTVTTAGHVRRAETGVHVDLMAVALTRGRMQIAVFGGGSHVQVDQRILGDVAIAETLKVTTGVYDFSFTGDPQTQLATTSGWGGNAGGQVLIAIAKHVSLGGLVRVTRAMVSVPNGVAFAFQGQDVKQKLTVGGVQAVAGMRFTF